MRALETLSEGERQRLTIAGVIISSAITVPLEAADETAIGGIDVRFGAFQVRVRGRNFQLQPLEKLLLEPRELRRDGELPGRRDEDVRPVPVRRRRVQDHLRRGRRLDRRHRRRALHRNGRLHVRGRAGALGALFAREGGGDAVLVEGDLEAAAELADERPDETVETQDPAGEAPRVDDDLSPKTDAPDGTEQAHEPADTGSDREEPAE